jgi:hypothetical protein
MRIPLVNGPLHGDYVSDSEPELPPEGLRTSFYAVVGDGTAHAYRLRRFRDRPDCPAEYMYEGLVPHVRADP